MSYILFSLFSVVLCFFGFKYFLKNLKHKMSRDMHKKNIIVPESAGVVLVISFFISATLFSIYANTQINYILIVALFQAFLGLLDDYLNLRQSAKALLSFVPAFLFSHALFLINFPTSISFIFFNIDLGFLYFLFAIPFALAVVSNLTNMLAGLNGMDSILPALLFAFQFLILFFKGANPLLLFISLSMALMLFLTFFKFTRYPSKFFMGDVGNLFTGSLFAMLSILGKIEFASFLIALPYILEFFIKMKNGFPKAFCKYDEKTDTIYAPNKKITLFHILIGNKKMKEKDVVLNLILLQFISGLIALILFISF